jgi:hypothetical protein
VNLTTWLITAPIERKTVNYKVTAKKGAALFKSCPYYFEKGWMLTADS